MTELHLYRLRQCEEHMRRNAPAIRAAFWERKRAEAERCQYLQVRGMFA